MLYKRVHYRRNSPEVVNAQIIFTNTGARVHNLQSLALLVLYNSQQAPYLLFFRVPDVRTGRTRQNSPQIGLQLQRHSQASPLRQA